MREVRTRTREGRTHFHRRRLLPTARPADLDLFSFLCAALPNAPISIFSLPIFRSFLPFPRENFHPSLLATWSHAHGMSAVSCYFSLREGRAGGGAEGGIGPKKRSGGEADDARYGKIRRQSACKRARSVRTNERTAEWQMREDLFLGRSEEGRREGADDERG